MAFYPISGPPGPAGPGGGTQTGPEIVALLAALSGSARLSYNSLKDNPSIPNVGGNPQGNATALLQKLLLGTTVYRLGAAWDDITGKPDRLLAFTAALQAKLEGLNSSALDIAQTFYNDLFRRDTILRTLGTNLSTDKGEVIISTGNNPMFGTGDFVGIDVEDAADNDETDHIEAARTGDYIFLEENASPPTFWMLAQIQGIDTPVDTAVRRIWVEHLINSDGAGFNTWFSNNSGAVKIHFSEHIANWTTAELTDMLDAVFAKLDGTNLTTQFKNDVRSPADPYTFASNYTRLADGLAVPTAGQWILNAAPTLNGAPVQLTITLNSPDVISAVERWLVGNELLAGTMRFKLQGAATHAGGNQYIASVVWIRGADQTGSSSMKLEEDTPHRDEFADVAFSGSYADLSDPPQLRSRAGTHRSNSSQPTGATGTAAEGVSILTASYTPSKANARIHVKVRLSGGVASNSDNDYMGFNIRFKRGSGNYKRMDESADGFTPWFWQRQWQYWDNGPSVKADEFVLPTANNTDQITVNLGAFMSDSGNRQNVTFTLNPTKYGETTGPSYIEIYEEDVESGSITYQTTTTLDSA